MHRYRWNMHKSYDLSGHIGQPNYVPDVPFPEGVVRFCKVHGYIKLEDSYSRMSPTSVNPTYYCKFCARDTNIRNNYEGMESMKDYNKMLLAQNSVCYICKNPSTQKSNNKKTIKSLAIDHDHATGKVRKLLCGACNSALGYVEDSIEKLQQLINYLIEHAPK